MDFDAIVRCAHCDLATVQTPPTLGALGEFYSAYYASTSYGTKRDKKIKRAAKRVRRLSRDIKSKAPSTGKRRFLDVGTNLGYAVEGARLQGFAAALMDLVAPGGVLFITTPADGHRATPKPLVSWVQVKPPEHIHWFAKAHMLSLFDHDGFHPRFQYNPKSGHKMRLLRDL